MSELTFVFESDELKSEFMGWFSDGGGEDAFCDAMSNRDIDVGYIKFFGDNVVISSDVKKG